MADNTPRSREEALLQNILGAQNEIGIPKSRIEKVWQYALGIDGVELEPAKSRIEVLAIQVAELVRNGGGGTVDHTVEDALIEGTLTGEYENPRVTAINPYGFYSQDGLTVVRLALVTRLGANAFLTYTTSSIRYIELPSVQTINAQSFRGCGSLATLNLYSPDRTTIPTLANTNAFTNTPIASGTGYVVINDSLVDSLKAASNWTAYSSQIIGHSDAISQGLITA